ncbi:MAG: cell division protein FtsL [Nitrospira sp.]|nr:cell division protein FtsL [bacterium]MBL7048189.1 cell division protein FtsL [Nitrospira sp.]
MTGRRTRKSKRGAALAKFTFAVYLGFCLFAVVWLRSEVINLEYEIGHLNKFQAELKRESQFVMAERSKFYSTEKIEKVAMMRLGMSMPQREKVYFVKNNNTATAYRASLR